MSEEKQEWVIAEPYADDVIQGNVKVTNQKYANVVGHYHKTDNHTAYEVARWCAEPLRNLLNALQSRVGAAERERDEAQNELRLTTYCAACLHSGETHGCWEPETGWGDELCGVDDCECEKFVHSPIVSALQSECDELRAAVLENCDHHWLPLERSDTWPGWWHVFRTVEDWQKAGGAVDLETFQKRHDGAIWSKCKLSDTQIDALASLHSKESAGE